MEFINNLQQIVTSHAPRTPERIFLASLFALRGFKLLGSLWKYIKPLPKLNKAYANSWAVITGGTSGIGLELAEKFAQNGLNLILIARNATNLEKVSTMLASKYSNIQVIWISLDANAPNWENVMKTLSQCPISILVNNVGVHNSIPANIDQLSLDEIARIINVNCLFQVQFTSLVVPIMKNYRNTYTGQPKIINISSLTSKLDMPMLSVYAASKAFIDHWSINLAAELANDNISVLCLRPGLTVSPMSGEKKSSLFIPTAEAMATACYRMITERDLLIVPYLPHLFLDYINQFIPRSLTWSIVRDMHQKKRNELLDLELEASISPAKVSSTATAETTTTSPTTPTTPRTK